MQYSRCYMSRRPVGMRERHALPAVGKIGMVSPESILSTCEDQRTQICALPFSHLFKARFAFSTKESLSVGVIVMLHPLFFTIST